jgi:hypothetical protein
MRQEIVFKNIKKPFGGKNVAIAFLLIHEHHFYTINSFFSN